MVSDQSKVGKIVLHKNGENAELLRKLPTTQGEKSSSETPCQSTCDKKSKGPPMVARFLLYDPSNMSIGGVSGKRKFSIWGGMLEGHCRCQEALCILECLLCRGGPLQRLGPSPSGDQLKGATPVHSWAENGGKFTMPRKHCSCLMS